MRVPITRKAGSLEFNMTPMIDVTFLLIIFFLISSHLAQQEIQMQLDLPAAESGRRTEEAEAARRVTVNVLADGQILLGSQAVNQAELAQRIAFESREKAAEGQELEVRIRCDRKVSYRFVEPILLTCAKSGVWNVTFSVVEREPG